jgi:outer membrane protein assembly factor BamD (BamD/ComL family)
MNAKLKIHLRIFAALVIVTAIIYYVSSAPPTEEKEYLDDDFKVLEEMRDDSSHFLGTIKSTAIPFVITLLYGSYLAYTFAFPYFAERMSDSVYEPHNLEADDLLFQAQKEVTEGDYAQAIANYRELLKRDHSDSKAVMEIAKIQRKHLEKSRQAADGLQQALDSREWTQDETTKMLSYIAEIYEVDFCDHIQAIRILEGIIKDFPDSRYAANATSKIKEFDKLSQG